MLKKVLFALFSLFSLIGATVQAGLCSYGDICDFGLQAGYLHYENCDFSWTGFYTGVHGGLDWVSFVNNESVSGTRLKNHPINGDLGVHLGYQIQDHYDVVYSLEGTFDGAFLKKTRHLGVNGVDFSFENRIDWYCTITPRIGYAFCNWLLFFKGGGAFARVRNTITVSNLGHASRNTKQLGGTFGIGFEHAFNCFWVMGVEFNYFILGKRDVGGTFLQTGPNPQVVKIHNKVSNQGGNVLFRLGVLF